MGWTDCWGGVGHRGGMLWGGEGGEGGGGREGGEAEGYNNGNGLFIFFVE